MYNCKILMTMRRWKKRTKMYKAHVVSCITKFISWPPSASLALSSLDLVACLAHVQQIIHVAPGHGVSNCKKIVSLSLDHHQQQWRCDHMLLNLVHFQQSLQYTHGTQIKKKHLLNLTPVESNYQDTVIYIASNYLNLGGLFCEKYIVFVFIPKWIILCLYI